MEFKKGMKFSNGKTQDIIITNMLDNEMIEYNFLVNPSEKPYWCSKESLVNWINKTGARTI